MRMKMYFDLSKMLVWMLMFSMSVLGFTSCSSDDDDDTSTTTSAEKKLLGQWIENGRDKDTETEVLEVTFYSNHYAIWKAYTRGNVISTKTYQWSAASGQITVTCNGQTETSEYSIKKGLLYVGEIVYEKVETGEDYSKIGMENGHLAIDLGLSVRWAACNVGADSPEEYGSFYAWGRTNTQSYYSIFTYHKYTQSDGKTTLEPTDDAASVNMGGTWRTPTREEFAELCNKCTWTRTDDGWKVKGKNGNYIIIPMGGYYAKVSFYRDVAGYYWTSTLNTDDTSRAYDISFNSEKVVEETSSRYLGMKVRAVCD